MLLVLLAVAGPLPAEGQTFESGDIIMGDYEGEWTTPDGRKGRAIAQIRSLADNAYDGFVTLERGRKSVAVFRLATLDPKAGGPVSLQGASIANHKGGELLARIEAKGQILDGRLSGSFSGDLGTGSFDTKRFHKVSPTEGAKPPEGALQVFAGKDASAFKDFNWKLTPDDAMQAQTGNITTRVRLKNYRMHLEFRVPFLPRELGQRRGNSGVFLQSLYEVQILDSFGVHPLQSGDCGGLYAIKEPRANACLPPGRWQTYDITYREIKENGREYPTITVIQNGVVIMNGMRIPEAMIGKGPGGGDPNGGFLLLQYHNNPVQFRNIWVLPLKAQD
jgi:hypothetical protein